jgi:hypothetical protein
MRSASIAGTALIIAAIAIAAGLVGTWIYHLTTS